MALKQRAQRYPEKIVAALDALKKRSENNVVLRVIRGNYYAYEEADYLDAHGAKKHASLYIGKISADGTLIKPRHRKQLTTVKSVGQLVTTRLEMQESDGRQTVPDSVNIAILKMISTDGRMPIATMASQLRMSTAAVRYRLERLEKQYGIRYTIEFAARPFGLFRYVAFVKFTGKRPDRASITKLLSANPMIQFVALTRGAYDMVIYMLAENTQTLEDMIYEIRSDKGFADYAAHWHVSYITYGYGYVPFRQEFVEWMGSKVWKRTRDTPRRLPNQLLEREYLVLKELNLDGSVAFNLVDKKYGLNQGSTDYTYHRLVESGTLFRVTINMTKVPIKYNAIIILKQINVAKFNDVRKEVMHDVIRETTAPVSSYALVGDTGAPYGIVYIASVFEEGGLEQLEQQLSKRVKESDIETAIITEVLVGSLGLRYLDSKHTYQYRYLKEHQD